MKTNLLSSEIILNQLPIMAFCMNVQHRFIASNKQFALLQGYENIDQILGEDVANIPCKAAKASGEWKKQNEEVVQNRCELTLLDIHPYYVDNRIALLLSKKSPLFDEANHIIGVGCAGMEIQKQTMLNIAFQIAKSDKRYRVNKNVNQRSYSIFTSSNNSNLSKREMECLFYLVRGKTARETAEVLQLSRRTVEEYIENIKNKMACFTKSQVIEKAINNNLIDIIPDSLFANMNLTAMI